MKLLNFPILCFSRSLYFRYYKLINLFCLLLLFQFFFNSLTAQKIIPISSADGSVIFVNKENRRPVNAGHWDEADHFKNGFYRVFKKGKTAFVNDAGVFISNTLFDEVRNFSFHVAAVKNNGKWGFLDEQGKILLPLEYDFVFDFKVPATGVLKNGKWLLVNTKGKLLKELNIDQFWGFNGGRAKVTRKGAIAFIDLMGNILSPGWKNLTTSNSEVMPQGINESSSYVCPPNIDFEAGDFSNWNCFTGGVTIGNNSNNVSVQPSPPTPNRHELILGSATLPPPLDPYGLFPITPPDGSNFAIKLGNTNIGAEAERVRYEINVPANAAEYSLIYQYAVVFQDPGHTYYEQPRFTVKLFDPVTNSYLSCASVEYVATDNLPGFATSPVSGNADILYKPWSSVFMNLSQYAGKKVYLEFTTADCTRTGHWGYAYVDINDCGTVIKAQNSCSLPVKTNLSGPPGFSIYKWWNNGYTALLGTGQQLVLSPGLPLNTTVHLELIPYVGFGCKDTLTTQVIPTILNFNAGPDKVFCKGNTALIGSTSIKNCIYNWTPNNFISSTVLPKVSVFPETSTSYFVKVTDTLLQCETFDTVKIVVNPLPDIVVNSLTICSGDSVAVIASGADTYSWSPSSGLNNISGNSVKASPTNTTNYTVTGSITATGCFNKSVSKITVNSKPIASFSQPANQCLSVNNYTITSTSSILSGMIASQWWSFGDLTSGSGLVATHSYNNIGSYSIKLLVNSDAGCKDSIVKTVSIYPDPIPNVIANRPLAFCAGDSVKLSSISIAVSGSIISYQWYINGIIIPGATFNAITVFQSGDYQLEVTNTNNCKKISAVIPVTVFPLPIGSIIIPSNTLLCEGSSLILSTTGGNFYQWYKNNLLIAAANFSTYNTSDPGVYSVQLTSLQGCKNFASGIVNLTVFKKPIPDFNYPVACANVDIPFINNSNIASSGSVSWSWDFGDGSKSSLMAPTHNYLRGTDYPVSLTISPANCPNLVTTIKKIVPIEDPISGIRYTALNATKKMNLPLQARTFAKDYLWTPSVGLSSSSSVKPIFNFDFETDYVIRLTTAAGCITFDSLLVRVFAKVDIQVPKAFTPNGDGHNDRLDIFLIGIGKLNFFRVFNRWGLLLFETKDPNQLWYGTYKGVKQPLETYVWTAEGVGSDGITVSRRGQTILIR
jgi:gliding motility-associated-like protein